MSEDSILARRIAEGAGALLLALRATSLLEGRALGATGDRIANTFILGALAAWRPDDAVLSEEGVDSAARLECSRVWIIDPLDGTREYAEGRDDWAVHVALSIDGHPTAGAVALPALGVTLATDDAPQAPAACAKPTMLVSRTRPPAEALALARLLGADLLPMGSAGAKAMAVVRGEADYYVHSGGQHEWDNCAPAAVALAAGLHVSRLDGSPLRYNRADVSLPDLLICRREDAGRLLGMLRELGSPRDGDIQHR